MPSLGVPELVLILVIVIIVFGVGRLPEVGGALGKGIREFRRASAGLDEESTSSPSSETTHQKNSEA